MAYVPVRINEPNQPGLVHVALVVDVAGKPHQRRIARSLDVCIVILIVRIIRYTLFAGCQQGSDNFAGTDVLTVYNNM